MELQVTKIPRKRTAPAQKSTLRAAAYARVSTDHSDQITSYEMQVKYYKEYIQSREDWELAGVYTDEGITGTSTKKRPGFRQMISDALDGKIDVIITKSVSRFARNAVDLLSTVHQLKRRGIEVIFERENIHTLDGKSELLLSIMAVIAQEEAHSVSENCKWGQRERYSKGQVTVPFKRFLGYDRGENGELVINEEQAKIVRRIYDDFLNGQTPYAIAKALTAEKIPTPGGKAVWRYGVIKSILTNEKYKGEALLQKVYTPDYLTKEKVKNNGEVDQYYVTGSHKAIIPPEKWQRVQDEMARRKAENP